MTEQIFLILPKWMDSTMREFLFFLQLSLHLYQQWPLIFESKGNFTCTNLFFTSKKWKILQNKTNPKTYPWKILLVTSLYNCFPFQHCSLPLFKSQLLYTLVPSLANRFSHSTIWNTLLSTARLSQFTFLLPRKSIVLLKTDIKLVYHNLSVTPIF